MKQVVESAAPIWRDDINYPGIPQLPDSPVASKITNRATVDYRTYVLAYTSRMVMFVMLAACGAAGAFLAVVALTGAAMVILAALSIGAIMAGSAGCYVIRDAHHTFTRYLAVSTTETRHERPAAPPPATVRPFVASSNGDGRTTNTARLNFTPQVWQSLFDRAMDNGGFIDRDNVCKRAGIGRRWYHSDPNSADGFRAFLAELRQLRFIDERNRLTPIALDWYEKQIPLPLASFPARSRIDRPTGDRPTTDRRNSAADTVEEWGGA